MVYEIEDFGLPVGLAGAPTPKGEYCPVIPLGFITPMNYPKFYDILDSLSLPGDFAPGAIDTMLGVIRKDGSASIYVNEVGYMLGIRVNNSLKRGQIVRGRDIGDVKSLTLDIEIPDDCGFFFVFHVGWVRCLFYDYYPILPDEMLKQTGMPRERDYDLPRTLGNCFRSVFFRQRLSHSKSDWDVMFENGWFPFFGLSPRHLNLLKDFWSTELEIDEIVENIAEDLKKRLPELLETWKNYESFADFHSEDIGHAVEYFFKGDHKGCGYILYPKIEGIMRSDYLMSQYREDVLEEKIKNPRSGRLREFATTVSDTTGLLLPDKFKEYLEKVVFGWAEIEDREAKPGRQSVAHGFARNWSKETSVIALLTFEHLMRFIMERQWEIDEG